MRTPDKNPLIEAVLQFAEGAIASRKAMPEDQLEEYQRIADSHFLTGLRLILGVKLYTAFVAKYKTRKPGFHHDAVPNLDLPLLELALRETVPFPGMPEPNMFPAPDWMSDPKRQEE